MEEFFRRWQIFKMFCDHDSPVNISCINDDEAKVTFALKCCSFETKAFDNSWRQNKSSKKALEYIEKGNEHFTCMPVQNLIEIYNKAIMHAEIDSNELARAYANRSAALYNGRLYEDSLIDIERALKIGYKDNVKAKLYARRANCLYILKKKMSPEVAEALADTRKWLEKMDDENKKYIMNIIERFPDNLSIKKPYEKFDYCKFVPKTPEDNPKIPGASRAIELKYSRKLGRHVVATRDIIPGETLYVRKCYASIIDPDVCHKFCWNCSKQVWGGVPCNQCVNVIYCNEDCRDEAWTAHHDIECPVIHVIFEKNMGTRVLIVLRMTIKTYKEAKTIKKLQTNIDAIDLIHDPVQKCFTDNVFDDTKHASLWSLWRPNYVDADDATLASIILYILGTTTKIFGEKMDSSDKLLSNKQATFMGELIMTHVRISENRKKVIVRDENLNQVDRGITFDPFLSMFNHTCDPVILNHMSGDVNVLVAIQKIKKGEQICLGYGITSSDAPTPIRQQYLLNTYEFLCQCMACIKGWGPFSYMILPSHLKTLPKALRRRWAYLEKKYPEIPLLPRADVKDKPHIISTLVDTIKFYENSRNDSIREMYDLKCILIEVYASVRC